MLDEDRALDIVPEHVVVVAHHSRHGDHKVRVDAVLLELGQIVLAYDVVADVREKRGVEPETRGAYGRIRAIADGVADVD